MNHFEESQKTNKLKSINEEENDSATNKRVTTNRKSMFSNDMFGLWRESLKKVCSDSKVHGLSNIADNENIIIKIMWGILFLMAFGASAYCNFFFVYGLIYHFSKKTIYKKRLN